MLFATAPLWFWLIVAGVPAAGFSGKLPSASQQATLPSQAPAPCSICTLGSPK